MRSFGTGKSFISVILYCSLFVFYEKFEVNWVFLEEDISLVRIASVSVSGGGLLNVTHEVNFPPQKKISFVLCILRRLSAKEEK